MSTDLQAFLQYYLVVQLLGLAAWPLTRRLFKVFPDQGWGLSKVLGLLLTTWVIWVVGSLKLAPFTLTTSLIIVVSLFLLSYLVLPLVLSFLKIENWKFIGNWKLEIGNLRLILFEELLFLAAFGFWTYVRAFSPDIRGLEKFMDYGFLLSILRGEYFPPLDHFLAGETINYYYFGHLMAAVLTKLSGVTAAIAFNLQIALLFGLTVLSAFSVGSALHFGGLQNNPKEGEEGREGKEGEVSNHPTIQPSNYLAGILAALFVVVIGNLHAISNLRTLNSYWYPTASRLIPNTINEFPVYSFVVADLHGHVSDIPIVLLIMALLFSYVFTQNFKGDRGEKGDRGTTLIFLALAIGATYATNSWDYPIFLGLTGLVFLLVERKNSSFTKNLKPLILKSVPLFSIILLFSIALFLPYWLTVRPIGKGIGLVGFVDSFNPKDLQEIKNLALPLYVFKRFVIRSPLNLLFLLWGLYGFLAVSFVVFKLKVERGNKGDRGERGIRQVLIKTAARLLGLQVEVKGEKGDKEKTKALPATGYLLPATDLIALLLTAFAFLLILFPEWVYINDIYKPDYYRANTLFKFYYAAWIMLGVATAHGLVRILSYLKTVRKNILHYSFLATCFLLLASVFLYPILAINSITGKFAVYKGLDGVASWMKLDFPTDYQAVQWINQNISGQPTFVEAVGESYTDASRITAMTGIPTVLGWPVHEWLWRGSYTDPIQPTSQVQKRTGEVDTVGQRVTDVQQFYEAQDLIVAKNFLEKYQVDYIYLGKMEREKYPSLYEEKLGKLGEVVYENEGVKIYKVVVN